MGIHGASIRGCAVPNYISDREDLTMGLVSGNGHSEAETEELDLVLEGGRCLHNNLCGCRPTCCGGGLIVELLRYWMEPKVTG